MIDHAEVRALAAEEGFPRVSIYLPTHRAGPGLRQDPIQLKNLMREAAKELEGQGLGSREIDAFLGETAARRDDGAFWRSREDGLAVFVSDAGTRILSTPIGFEAQVHVGARFVVRPLLPLLVRGGTFVVLAASQDDVALYRGSRFGLVRIADERLPRSAAAILGSTEIENAVGFHAASRGGGAIRVHALGESPRDEMEGLIDEFARATARSVDAILAGERVPVVLAADDRLLGKLRKALGHRELTEEAIREHPASLDQAALHARAYAIAAPRLDDDRNAVIERLEARLGDGVGKASDRIEEIVAAAEAGRVESLVVATRDAGPADLGWAPGRVPDPADAMDLLDRAILETLAHGGSVHPRPTDRAADLPAVAALYRY